VKILSRFEHSSLFQRSIEDEKKMLYNFSPVQTISHSFVIFFSNFTLVKYLFMIIFFTSFHSKIQLLNGNDESDAKQVSEIEKKTKKMLSVFVSFRLQIRNATELVTVVGK